MIHLARIYPKGRLKYIALRKEGKEFVWEGSTCCGKSHSEAIAAGRRHFKEVFFKLVSCGFRYSLPIRDETGTNALFSQMVKSYASPRGVYFDEDVGHPCLVKFASEEALSYWKKIS